MPPSAAPASRWSPSVVLPRLPGLVVGLIVFAVGIALMAEAGMGLGPWEAFHQGIARLTGLELGTVSILLGIPIPWILFQNAANLGVIGGFMFQAGKADVLFGLLIPQGLLELSAVFLAGAVGMRLGWMVIAPGDRPRGQVLAEQGRAVVAVAVGLVAVLLVSGLIEALVTPAPLPTFVRIGIGLAAELGFLSYIVHFGRRAVRAGETGDIEDAPDVVPTG